MRLVFCQDPRETNSYLVPNDIFNDYLIWANYWNDRGYKVKPFSFYYTYGLSDIDKKKVIKR
jgi:hypothetical protein